MDTNTMAGSEQQQEARLNDLNYHIEISKTPESNNEIHAKWKARNEVLKQEHLEQASKI